MRKSAYFGGKEVLLHGLQIAAMVVDGVLIGCLLAEVSSALLLWDTMPNWQKKVTAHTCRTLLQAMGVMAIPTAILLTVGVV